MANIRREIAEGLGDVAREGLERLVKKADDWGWKGGKKGEITGSMWNRVGRDVEKFKITPEEYDTFLDRAYEQFAKAGERGKPIGAELERRVARASMFDSGPTSGSALARDMRDAAEGLLNDFYLLERAGIPRAWTGRVLDALSRANFSAQRISTLAPEISSAMRPLTNQQRETFLNLLARDMTGRPFVDLAEAAKKLYRR